MVAEGRLPLPNGDPPAAGAAHRPSGLGWAGGGCGESGGGAGADREGVPRGRAGSERGPADAGEQDARAGADPRGVRRRGSAVRGEQGAGGGREGRDLRRRRRICAGRSSGICRPTRPSWSPASPASSTPSTRSRSRTPWIGDCTTAGAALDVFVQVNSSGEESKFGLPPEEVESFVGELPRPRQPPDPRTDDPGRVLRRHRRRSEACFVRMQELQERLRNLGTAPGSYDELSMGMSNDYELAIAHGATTVRVGEAIFGARLEAPGLLARRVRPTPARCSPRPLVPRSAAHVTDRSISVRSTSRSTSASRLR